MIKEENDKLSDQYYSIVELNAPLINNVVIILFKQIQSYQSFTNKTEELQSPRKSNQFTLNRVNYDDLDLEFEEKKKKNLINQRKTLAFVGHSGIDVDFNYGYGQRESLQSLNKKRYTTLQDQLEQTDQYSGFDIEKISEYFGYCILILPLLLNSVILSLMLTLPLITWIRNAWRFFIQALILVPFVLWEYRTSSDIVRQSYTLKIMFKKKNIRKLFLQSFNTSMQTTIYIITSNFNYIANVLLIFQIQLKNQLIATMVHFWLSITRVFNNEARHKIEFSGQIMCIIGVLIVSYDSYTITSKDLPTKYLTEYTMNNHFFMDPIQKLLIGIGVPVLVAIITTQISIMTSDLNQIYPPFLQLFFVSIFTSLNLHSVGYFFYLTSVDGIHYTGWFGFIFDGCFSQFMYYSSVYCILILICQVFSGIIFEPYIVASCNLLEPALTGFFLDVFKQQFMPSYYNLFIKLINQVSYPVQVI